MAKKTRPADSATPTPGGVPPAPHAPEIASPDPAAPELPDPAAAPAPEVPEPPAPAGDAPPDPQTPPPAKDIKQMEASLVAGRIAEIESRIAEIESLKAKIHEINDRVIAARATEKARAEAARVEIGRLAGDVRRAEEAYRAVSGELAGLHSRLASLQSAKV